MIRSARLLLVAFAPLFAVGCGDDSAGGPPDRYGGAYRAVCEAAQAAADGESARAEEVFFDDAHQPLHELAAQVTDADRPTAARLHEAKQAAEVALRREHHSGELAALAHAMRDALDGVDHPAPQRCRTGE